MFTHKLRGTWDQVAGLGREFWGELSGNEKAFTAGQRQRMIGRLEVRNDLSRAEAARRCEQHQ